MRMSLRSARRLTRAAALAAAVTSAFVACNLGDDYYPPPSFGGRPGAFFDSGSSSPTEPEMCERIQLGARCVEANPSMLPCEEKKHANPACNDIAECGGSGWELVPAEKTSCVSECPAAHVTDLPDGCAMPNAGSLICEYPEGTCGCAPVRPVVPDAGAGEDAEVPDDFDAGDGDAGLSAYVWTCVTPEAGCPRTRPRIGSNCVRPMRCDYGDCVFEDGVTMRCYSGTWTTEKRCDF